MSSRATAQPDPEAPTAELDSDSTPRGEPEPTVARLQAELDQAGIRYFQARELLFLPKVGRYVRHREIDEELMRNLVRVATLADYVRAEVGAPLYVTSAFRPETYNTLVGGAELSQHLLGKAIDLNLAPRDRNEAMVEGLRATVVRLWRQRVMGFGGLGLYATARFRVHLDVGPHRSWTQSEVEPVVRSLESAGHL